MERTKKLKEPDLILTGDWHLREDTPVCRTEIEFQKDQWGSVDFVSELQKKYNCPVIHSGDLYNNWKPSPWLLSMSMKHIPNNFWTIYGNHDLPQHNLELADKCGINVLKEAGKLKVLEGTHWGKFPTEASYHLGVKSLNNEINILVWHVMSYQGKLPWPGCSDPLSAGLIRKHKYDLILLGHNHKPFVEEYNGRLLVNPGSLTRQNADQANYKPCVWLWYAETNTVVPVYLPIENDVVSRDHIEIQEQRENRIDAFISRLNTDWEASLSFEENLEIFEKENQVRKSVMDIIYKSLE
jgi:DNA repair exonuclease SbcCD nuclease subunit